MKQFTFLGSNWILSKVQKSFWSCNHVNSFQKYALYVNLHILFMIYFKTNLNIQKLLKSNKYIRRYMQINVYYFI